MKTLPQILRTLKGIKAAKRYVKNHRPTDRDGGVGRTLEDLVGIKENNVQGADGKNIELKSGRKNTNSMMSLVTQAPLPEGANSRILKLWGYPSKRDKNKPSLHSDVTPLAFNKIKGKPALKLVINKKRIFIIDAKRRILGFIEIEKLRQNFHKKFLEDRILYVKAQTKELMGIEWFLYDEAWLIKGFTFQTFMKRLKDGIIKYELRIGHYPDGRVHDHGSGFRVLPKNFVLCSTSRKRVL